MNPAHTSHTKHAHSQKLSINITWILCTALHIKHECICKLSQHPQIILQIGIMKTEVMTDQTLADSIKPLMNRKDNKGKDTFDMSDWWKAFCAKLPAFTYVLRAVLTNSHNHCQAKNRVLQSIIDYWWHEAIIDLEIAQRVAFCRQKYFSLSRFAQTPKWQRKFEYVCGRRSRGMGLCSKIAETTKTSTLKKLRIILKSTSSFVNLRWRCVCSACCCSNARACAKTA